MKPTFLWFALWLSASPLWAGEPTVPALRAIAPEKVTALLEGKGLEMAKSAELNHHPGPAHVLELAEPLGLAPEQIAQTRANFQTMQDEAKRLGQQWLEEEAALEARFSSGDINEETLQAALERIGALQSRLRGVHLQAHLRQARLLTPEQIAHYETLRGYHTPGTGHSRHHP